MRNLFKNWHGEIIGNRFGLPKGNAINQDLKHPQIHVSNSSISKSIVDATTGVEALRQGLFKHCYETGYMHNHLRMYTAAVACNMGYSHWKVPAQWMYYHCWMPIGQVML